MSTYAAAPFDHAKADIILRSSDNINFRVFKLFLSLASPFFETLFDLPQPTQAGEDHEIQDDLVVIPVTEDSKTLDIILRFCYPGTLADDPDIVVEGIGEVMNAFEAARKYSLDAIEKKVSRAIFSSKILEKEPLRCFVTAHRGRLREEALLAAKYTLTQPLIPSWSEEIGMLNTGDLLSLLSYHQRCGDAVYALKNNLSWITPLPDSNWLIGSYSSYDSLGRRCRCAPTSRYAVSSNRAPEWWEDFMEETFTALRDKPCKSTVQASAEKTVQEVKASGCGACSPKVTEGMHELVKLFSRTIEKTVSQVSCTLLRFLPGPDGLLDRSS